jgi:3-oxoacyl-[acyl-carrier-protein] synthase II
VIERAEHARAHGVRALAALRACEVVTAGARADALDVARHLAFDRVSRRPDAWWASGMGSVGLDGEECRVLGKTVHAPVTTSKGTIGTAFECSALIDLVTAVAALERNVIPPVGRLRTPDPALGAIDFVVGRARDASAARTVLVTGMSPGEGTTAGAAILERTDDSE